MLRILVLVAVLVSLLGWRLAAQPPVTITEAEATQPAVPPAPVPPSETLGWMFTLGILSNALMKRMQTSAWLPWVKSGAGKINIVIAGLLAAISAAGIHTEFDKAAGTFLVTGLTVTGIVHFLGEWIRQWALQQWTFNTTKT